MSESGRLLAFPAGPVTPAHDAATDTALYKGGMRRLAAGVSIITTEHHGERYGMAATAVTSVSAEPPTLLVCIGRSGSSHEPIRESGRFCVNVLAETDRAVAEGFFQKD
jgi:flavin reductase (DIM6/NTAB) family NADH-FMN oxidoreductase RutF